MTTPLIARAAWVSVRIIDLADGWRLVVVQCPCSRVECKAPPDSLLADALDRARELHQLQAGLCPHRCRR